MENNYISAVLNKIKDEKVKAEIQAELEDHYNERVEYYTRIGYDKETAEAKANAHFGENAEIVGEQISSINGKNVWRNIIYTAINVFYFAVMLLIALGAAFFNDPFIHGYLGSFAVLLFTVFAFTELLVALRNKSAYLAGVGAVGIAVFGIFYLGYSPLVFGICKLFKGEGKRFLDLLGSYDWRSVSIPIDILSIIFYAFCVSLCLYAAYLSVKFQKCEYEKRHIRQEKRLKLVTIITMVFVIAAFAIILLALPKHFAKYDHFKGVYIVESDEIIDLVNIEDNALNHITIEWDSYDEGVSGDLIALVDYNLFETYMNEYDDDTDVVYKSYIMYGEFQPTKKYVCIVPDDGNDTDSENCEWFETSQEQLFVSERYNVFGSIVQCKVKILPREAQ